MPIVRSGRLTARLSAPRAAPVGPYAVPGPAPPNHATGRGAWVSDRPGRISRRIVRVALDTNVLVSAVATRGLCADLFNLVLAEHELIVGETVLTELKRILREKIRVPGKIIDE